jgi:hypothetical protein
MIVINPTTLAVSTSVFSGMANFPSGMAWNQNASSSQFDKVVVACSAGVIIFNPATGLVSTTIANPSSIISTGREIRYNATLDKYYVANLGNSTVVELSIASATTFTASKIVRNISSAYSLHIDHTAGYIFVTSVDSGTTVVLLNIFDSTTLELLSSFRTNAALVSGATDTSAWIDTANRRIFVTGRRTTSNAAAVVKY